MKTEYRLDTLNEMKVVCGLLPFQEEYEGDPFIAYNPTIYIVDYQDRFQEFRNLQHYLRFKEYFVEIKLYLHNVTNYKRVFDCINYTFKITKINQQKIIEFDNIKLNLINFEKLETISNVLISRLKYLNSFKDDVADIFYQMIMYIKNKGTSLFGEKFMKDIDNLNSVLGIMNHIDRFKILKEVNRIIIQHNRVMQYPEIMNYIYYEIISCNRRELTLALTNTNYDMTGDIENYVNDDYNIFNPNNNDENNEIEIDNENDTDSDNSGIIDNT